MTAMLLFSPPGFARWIVPRRATCHWALWMWIGSRLSCRSCPQFWWPNRSAASFCDVMDIRRHNALSAPPQGLLPLLLSSSALELLFKISCQPLPSPSSCCGGRRSVSFIQTTVWYQNKGKRSLALAGLQKGTHDPLFMQC
jgi:hypothetical protein